MPARRSSFFIEALATSIAKTGLCFKRNGWNERNKLLVVLRGYTKDLFAIMKTKKVTFC